MAPHAWASAWASADSGSEARTGYPLTKPPRGAWMLEGLWLVRPDEAMCVAWRHRFSGLPGVRVIRGRFEALEPHDCFVTAGNAFGLMTAGIDAAVVRRFGEEL